MMPGEYFLAEGTPCRAQGAVRDTVLILLPGPKVLLVVLHRTKLNGIAIDNELKHGCGSLQIDACRIRLDDSHVQSRGRWPSNFVLVHGPNCRKVGNAAVNAPVINRFVDGMKPFGGGAGHGYEQSGGGTEQVAMWDCQEDCPVKLLEQQSHATYSVSTPHGADGKRLDVHGSGWGFRRMATDVRDAGMASRFFPQFASLGEAKSWLARLVGMDV